MQKPEDIPIQMGSRLHRLIGKTVNLCKPQYRCFGNALVQGADHGSAAARTQIKCQYMCLFLHRNVHRLLRQRAAGAPASCGEAPDSPCLIIVARRCKAYYRVKAAGTPPSTVIMQPVVLADLEEARKAMDSAMSSG
ncbi:hypothetical protein D3C75_875420 [compost metagenome]